MSNKSYLLINSNNIVDNIIEWDGDTSKWSPPNNFTCVLKDTAPANVWVFNVENNTFVLTEVVGSGNIGFIWNPDTSTLTTNEEQPNK